MKLLKSTQTKEGRVWKHLALMNFATVAEIFRQFLISQQFFFLPQVKQRKENLLVIKSMYTNFFTSYQTTQDLGASKIRTFCKNPKSAWNYIAQYSVFLQNTNLVKSSTKLLKTRNWTFQESKSFVKYLVRDSLWK